MLQKIIIVFLVLNSFQVFSQELKVLISEKKTGKRIVLYAENKTSDTLNVFLIVNAEGYRKSASKPVIENILPNSKILMITLIELNEVDPWYTFDLIINEAQKDGSYTPEKQAKDIEKIISGKLVLFIFPNCDKCTSLIDKLSEKQINFRVFDINENPVIYRQFMAFIERQLTEETKIRFPVIWNKDELIFGYDEVEVMMKDIKSGG